MRTTGRLPAARLGFTGSHPPAAVILDKVQDAELIRRMLARMKTLLAQNKIFEALSVSRALEQVDRRSQPVKLTTPRRS
jgi:flagellar biosynthesis regulator FlbT